MIVLVLSAALAAAPVAPPARPALDPERVLVAATAGEPSVAAVQRAAAREADRAAPAAPGFARRSRLAALLPRLTLEYRRDEQSSRVVGLQGAGEVDYLRLAPGNSFGVKASWDLGGLVAARGELADAQQELERARRREAARARATALFFERRAALVALVLEPPLDARARAGAELALDRLTAELDALTGGLFGGGDGP